MVGAVSQMLASRIRAEVERHGVVVLFDAEQHYGEVLSTLDLGGAVVERFDGSYFELRHRIEPLLKDRAEPPRLLVYVPVAETRTHNALCELTACGVVMRPGRQPPILNTRLGLIARAGLVGVVADEALDQLERQADSGQLSLIDLDRVGDQTRGSSAGVLTLVFGAVADFEMALRFVSEPSVDNDLARRNGAPALVALLERTFGLVLDPTRASDELRTAVTRYVLVTELAQHLPDSLPATLAQVPHAPPGSQAAACVLLARTWRNRRDLQDAYVRAAEGVEQALGLADVELPSTTVLECETFPIFDRQLHDATVQLLIAEASEATIDLAERRQAGFWSVADGEAMKRWALLAAIARVRVAARSVGARVSGAPGDAAALVRAYREGLDAQPWSILDAHHRHMEARYYQFDLDHSEHTAIETLVARAREDYTRAISGMCERFGRALLEGGLAAPPLPRQLETFRRHVEPLVRAGKKVAYVLVDGLRYEMGEELHRSFGPDVRLEMDAMLGVLPSITEVGMVAVLPRADHDAELVATGKGRVAVALDGQLLRTRKDRMNYLERCIGEGFVELKLDDIVPPRGRTKSALAEARFVCVTATDELDGLCEKGNVAMARRMMDDVILQIRRAVRVLFDLGFERIVITADHGFLFGENLDEGSKIDAPGGETLDLHRRVWIGRGGSASESVYRLKAADVGFRGDLEIVVPRGVGAFRSGGRSTAYFHGGASLQELVVPVLKVEPGRPSVRGAGGVSWSVALRGRVVSTRFLSVQLSGEIASLFGAAAPLVRVDVLDGRTSLARAVAASYGFDEATGLVQLRVRDRGVEPNTVTLYLRELPKGKTVRIEMLDADTEKVLAVQADVPASIESY